MSELLVPGISQGGKVQTSIECYGSKIHVGWRIPSISSITVDVSGKVIERERTLIWSFGQKFRARLCENVPLFCADCELFGPGLHLNWSIFDTERNAAKTKSSLYSPDRQSRWDKWHGPRVLFATSIRSLRSHSGTHRIIFSCNMLPRCHKSVLLDYASA